MSAADYHTIVIGGGHNGLVAAAYLARAGQRVLLVERRAELGGASSTARSPDGQALEIGAQDLSLFRPEIIRDLRLELPLSRPEIALVSLLPDGGALHFWRQPARAAASIARYSNRDAERYPRFAAQVRRQAAILEHMLHHTPPDLPAAVFRLPAAAFRLPAAAFRLPAARNPDNPRAAVFRLPAAAFRLPAAALWLRAVWPWLGVALRLRRLGARPMIEFIRTLPMDAARLLEEWFERPEVAGALASAGIIGLMQGPKAAGTSLMLLYQSIGGFPRGSLFVRGGVQRVIDELRRAAESRGVEVRTGAAVEEILTGDYAALGVRLSDGSEVRASTVASSADPRHTLFDLVGAPELELRVARRVRNLRFRGSTARVNLALSELPSFNGITDPEQLMGHLVVAPSLDYLERAYDDAKYGRISAEPHLSMTVPTLHANAAVADGPHVLSVTVRYTPYRLADGDWEAQREALGDRVVELLGGFAPDLTRKLIHRQVLTPFDFESEYGLPKGAIHHGQMALDQLLFMRPIPGYAGYRSPVEGLYFCGAGAHPGGGLTGAPGRNAARVILKDLAKR